MTDKDKRAILAISTTLGERIAQSLGQGRQRRWLAVVKGRDIIKKQNSGVVKIMGKQIAIS